MAVFILKLKDPPISSDHLSNGAGRDQILVQSNLLRQNLFLLLIMLNSGLNTSILKTFKTKPHGK